MAARAEAAAQRGPGRPPSDAPDRILDAALDVLRRDGYAGLTMAKVAAASGQNKALISYYFGSKQGLVGAAAKSVSEAFVAEVLDGLGEPRTAGELVERLDAAIARWLDHDQQLARVYFDLASQSVVAEEAGEIVRELKQGYRAILRELLRAVADSPPARRLDAVAVFLIAGFEGLALERLARGETPALRAARGLFVRAARDAIG
jgi:AcrR family transcriptional regulator